MGPLVLKAVEEYCTEKSIGKDKLLAVGCSHIGGHKFAGVGVVMCLTLLNKVGIS